MSIFSGLQTIPPSDLGVRLMNFAKDTFPEKANLVAGIYYGDDGKQWMLPVVRSVQKLMADDENLDKEYLPLSGLPSYIEPVGKLLFGDDSPALNENRIFGVQTISASGAMRVGAEFLVKVLGRKVFYYSDPVWATIIVLFQSAGFEEIRTYRYWSKQRRCFDFEGMMEDLRNAPEGAVILMQVSAHNPTGIDPTPDQWAQIAQVIRERRLFPFFDSAMQGLSSGDLDEDVTPLRYFVEQGFELLCAHTFSKCMGLYNDRVGSLFFVLNNSQELVRVKSQMDLIVRALYSTAPAHGARIASIIMNNPELFQQWKDQVKLMHSKLVERKGLLRDALEKLGTPGDWSHLTKQTGTNCFTYLNEAQVDRLVQKHHVYMLSTGRINIAAVTPLNVQKIAESIHETVLALPS